MPLQAFVSLADPSKIQLAIETLHGRLVGCALDAASLTCRFACSLYFVLVCCREEVSSCVCVWEYVVWGGAWREPVRAVAFSDATPPAPVRAGAPDMRREIPGLTDDR